jgi:hypothetical protein
LIAATGFIVSLFTERIVIGQHLRRKAETPRLDFIGSARATALGIAAPFGLCDMTDIVCQDVAGGLE